MLNFEAVANNHLVSEEILAQDADFKTLIRSNG